MESTLTRIGDFTLFRNKADYDAYFDKLMDEEARAQWGRQSLCQLSRTPTNLCPLCPGA